MGNQWNNPVIIADKMLEFFDGLSEVAGQINRDYESNFQMTRESVGQTIYVEKPPRFTAQDGPTITTVQDINVGKIPVTVNKWKTVPIKLTGLDLNFNAKQFDIWAEKYLKPLCSPLANAVDIDVFGLWTKVANMVGVCGTGFGATAATAYDLFAAAQEKLTLVGNTPQEDRISYLSPTASRKYVSPAALGFNPQAEIGSAIMSGRPYRTAGFDVYVANNIGVYTGGTLVAAATITTSGVDQVGNAIGIAFTGGPYTLPVGAVVNFGGVYSVNPTSKQSTGILQDFVLTQAFSGTTTGTLYVDPPIIPSGAFQNVSNAAATAQTVTITGVPTATTGKYAMNLAFWKKALGLVTVPIKAPKGLNGVTRTYNNVSITISYGADIYNYEEIWRADIAYGVVCYYPENVCRIIGQ